MLFSKYPYTDMHEMNLDWILRIIKELDREVDEFVAFNKITFAGTWDGSAYPKWTIVDDGAGNGYLSIQAVPANVPLSNTDYWLPVSQYTALYNAFDARISALENIVGNMLTVSPMEFGAVGDGVTDDTAAVNAAGAAGVISDQKHVFYCAQPVTLDYGSVYTSYIMKEDQPIRCDGRLFVGNDVKSDGTFSPVRGDYLVTFNDIDSAVITLNRFHDAKNAVHLTNCPDAIIAHNTFSNLVQTNSNGYGIVTNGCDRCLIDSNIFKAVARHCVYISHELTTPGSTDVVISNNVIDLAGAVGMTPTAFPIQTRNVHRCRIHGNTVRNAQGFVWIIVDDMTADGSDDIEISNNSVSNITAPAGREHVDGVVSVSMEGTPANLINGIRIHDNVFKTSNVVLAKLTRADNVQIENNVFDSSANYAVKVEYGSGKMFSDGLFISGNTINISPANGTMFFILDVDDVGNVHISENKVECGYLVGTNVSSFTEGFDTLELSGNVYNSPNYRDFLNAAPIDKLIIKGNSGNIGKYVNASPTDIETDGRYNTVAFTSTAGLYQAATDRVASDAPYWLGNGYMKNNFKLLSRYYANLAALPTSEVVYGQIAITGDSHAYIWIGDSWLQLG